MTDYRSEYERYYKNINSSSGSSKRKKPLFSRLKSRDYSEVSYSGRNSYMSYDKGGKVVKILIRQLEASLILLVIFVGLKSAPSSQVQKVHQKAKFFINQTFEYDTAIDAMSNMEVGGFQMQNLHLENLKSQNIKSSFYNFIDYMKNINNINNTNIQTEQ